MKIRMKNNHQAVVEEVSDSIVVFDDKSHYYKRGMRDGEFNLYDCEEWEEFYEERWVDVTRDCHFASSGDTLIYNDYCVLRLLNVNFRIAKVRHNYQDFFIIEKKVVK